MKQLQEELLGYPAMLSCGKNPVEPIKWTFQSSSHFIVKDVKPSERFHIRGSSLLIYTVEAGDSGSFSCIDAAGDLHSIQLSVLGKLYQLSFLRVLFRLKKSGVCHWSGESRGH